MIHVDYADFLSIVRPKETIYVDDGKVSLQILEVRDDEVLCMAKEDGILFGRRSIRISGGSDLESMSSLTRADENDLIKLALGHNFDFVCASLNHRSKDIRYIRDVLGPKGQSISVFVKIDNIDSLHNFKDLI